MEETLFQKAISEAMKIQNEMESDFQFDLDIILNEKKLEFPLYHTLFGIYEVFDFLESYNDKDLFLLFLEQFWDGRYIGIDTVNDPDSHSLQIYQNMRSYLFSKKLEPSFFHRMLTVKGRGRILDLLTSQ